MVEKSQMDEDKKVKVGRSVTLCGMIGHHPLSYSNRPDDNFSICMCAMVSGSAYRKALKCELISDQQVGLRSFTPEDSETIGSDVDE
ncbi:hypothetical protein Tco_0662040 [Tanacetum coccineum]